MTKRPSNGWDDLVMVLLFLFLSQIVLISVGIILSIVLNPLWAILSGVVIVVDVFFVLRIRGDI